MKLSRKAEAISPSITLAITAKAKELKESGVDVISFGAGEPDFNTPSNIIEAAYKAMKEGKTKYTATSGIKELKEEICKKFLRDNGLKYDLDQIIVCTGAKQCLADAFMAILNEGDEVIIPTPYWVSYPELVKIAGGVPVFMEGSIKNHFKYEIEKLENIVTSKTKAIIINSPNNPTGTIYNKEELLELAKFAENHNLIIIADEIYEKLIYDGERHISIASLTDYAYNNTIVINGLSKAAAMTGWRIGYAAANKEIIKLMTSIQSHMTSNTNSITQYAAIEALSNTEDSLNKMVKEFDNRRKYMIKRLDSIKGINYILPKGAFYIMVNVSGVYGKSINEEKITDSLSFSKELLKEENVAVIPGIGFGLDDYIRLSYATSMENIENGIDRIEKFLNKLN
ncbi:MULTISPECIES: pyridoxal phosphate-dependent aminotransferase [Clostridium]|uniref:Aminotransferase n=1 Tax=Clostridium nitritogenes TaxID=83340 RepID=A0ABP3WWX5_9CLOT|nr:pyridoxal phosphate-dependent aminotransferase [Clostridium baratii]MBT9832871.1 aminotransferase class I/II-fold pyridoxal phosphate-dependent enzyme [Clostridium baratii]MDY3206960.1 pyridoxal phosphate-dependent aminotransferase [Clostridium baratii]STA99208.1 class I and II aminotransferase [Clostridium baratii]